MPSSHDPARHDPAHHDLDDHDNLDTPAPSAPTPDSPRLTAALAYAAAGVPVFPCHTLALSGGCSCHKPGCTSAAKHPATRHGVKDATLDQSTIRRWWGLDGTNEGGNIGIAMGEVSGRWALDVDPRHGGDEALAALETEHGALPATPRQDTPSGGWHLFFRCARGSNLGLKNRTSIAPGLDVRCDGGYVVGAPSIGVNGRPYLADADGGARATERLADAPEWLLDLARGNGRAEASPATAIPDFVDSETSPQASTPSASTPTRPPAPESLAARISAACAAFPAKVLAFFAENGIVGVVPQGDTGWHKGSAPWTDAGKDPSFGVHPATGSWKAHREGGATGGLIEFLVREKHMGERDAAREVCRALGIEWREESPEREKAKAEEEEALAIARATISEVDKLESVGGILTEDFASHAALLFARDPGSWARLNAKIEEKFKRAFRRSDFLRVVKHYVRDIPTLESEPSIAEEERGDPFGWFARSGVPRGSIVPRGFVLSKNGSICRYIERATQDGDVSPSLTPICDDPVFVVGVGINLATHDHTVTLAWRKGNRWFRHEFDRGEICEGKGLKALAQKGFAISCMTWNLLAEWIVKFESANFDVMPVRYVTSRFGPTKDEQGRYLGFMCGRTFISYASGPKDENGNPYQVVFQPSDAGDGQVAESIHQKGSMSACVAALSRLSIFPRAMIGLYASLAPPLLSILGAQNFGIDWWRDTSQGKTKTMMIAACPWGNPEPRGGGFIGTWDGTRVSFERRATLLNGLPVIADESQRAKSPEEMGASVYDIINGQARARGTIKGLAASLGGHVVLLSTGERPLVHAMKFGGLKARVISIHGGPFGDVCDATRDAVDEVSDILLKNYGHIGPAFIAWIHDHISEWKDWRQTWEDERAAYRSMAKGDNVAGRLCDYLATLEVTARLLHRALDLPWESEEIVESIWGEVESGAADADVARAAFMDVVGWCRSNEAGFIGQSPVGIDGEPIQPTGGWFGVYRKDGDWEWGVVPHKLTDFLKSQGYDSSVIKTWTDRAWTVTTRAAKKQKRDTVTARASNRVFRVYALCRREIAKMDDSEIEEV